MTRSPRAIRLLREHGLETSQNLDELPTGAHFSGLGRSHLVRRQRERACLADLRKIYLNSRPPATLAAVHSDCLVALGHPPLTESQLSAHVAQCPTITAATFTPAFSTSALTPLSQSASGIVQHPLGFRATSRHN